MLDEKLPRELRDMVYLYIGPGEQVIVKVDPWSDSRDLDSAPRSGRFYGCDHIWDEEFVGSTTLRELIEHWYRTSLFDFGCSPGRFRSMESMANEWTWTYGLVPAAFIEQVSVCIIEADLDGLISEQDPHYLKYINSRMEALFVFKVITKIHIDMRWFMDRWAADSINHGMKPFGSERQLRACIRVLVPLAKRLNAAGYFIEVGFGKYETMSSTDGEISETAWLAKLEDFERFDVEQRTGKRVRAKKAATMMSISADPPVFAKEGVLQKF
ncbi:hypothetical protein BDV96DRAFT_644358 [Lophiotrema nucula]|uniref:Uncharacterized protein n=1 Tax=Lophiotrema nucula TaxID=690887 RepID=A0A6A5ZFL0_9PLEO|nr:hypothetical protein BDV96DRAFT_644358 [Lophiotrema nucula]